MRALAAVLLAAAGALVAREGSACAVCSVGDPTLTSLGTEQPFAGRVRGAVELRQRTDAVGVPGVDRIELSEQRLEATVAWAPHERVFVSAVMPVLRRQIRYVNLARRQTWGPGEAEVRARLFMARGGGAAGKVLVATTLGLKLPTAPAQRGPDGERLPLELQPGTGSVDPSVGALVAWFAFPWSAYATALGVWPTRGTDGARASRSLRATVAGQRQLTSWFAGRLAVDGRLDGRAVEGGEVERDSGGAVGYLSPEVLLSPGVDWMLSAAVRWPVVERLRGFHREGVVASVTVARDF